MYTANSTFCLDQGILILYSKACLAESDLFKELMMRLLYKYIWITMFVIFVVVYNCRVSSNRWLI